MYLEVSCFDRTLTEDDVREILFLAIKHKFNGISVPSFFIAQTKDFIVDGMVLSCPVDYPYGGSDQSVKSHASLAAIRKGANALDIVMNNTLMVNKKLTKLYEEIESLYKLCKEHTVTPRIVLEYRFYDITTVVSIVNTLLEIGIEYIIPSTGDFLDNWDDNLTIAVELSKKTDANVITNGNVWQQKHFKAIKQSKVFGARLNSIGSVKNIFGV